MNTSVFCQDACNVYFLQWTKHWIYRTLSLCDWSPNARQPASARVAPRPQAAALPGNANNPHLSPTDDNVAVTVSPLGSEIVSDVIASGAVPPSSCRKTIALARCCKNPFLLPMCCGDTAPQYRKEVWSSSKGCRESRMRF